MCSPFLALVLEREAAVNRLKVHLVITFLGAASLPNTVSPTLYSLLAGESSCPESFVFKS